MNMADIYMDLLSGLPPELTNKFAHFCAVFMEAMKLIRVLGVESDLKERLEKLGMKLVTNEG